MGSNARGCPDGQGRNKEATRMNWQNRGRKWAVGGISSVWAGEQGTSFTIGRRSDFRRPASSLCVCKTAVRLSPSQGYPEIWVWKGCGGKKCKWILVGIRFMLVEMIKPGNTVGFPQWRSVSEQKENPEEAREKGARNGTRAICPKRDVNADFFCEERHWKHLRNLGRHVASPRIRPLFV